MIRILRGRWLSARKKAVAFGPKSTTRGRTDAQSDPLERYRLLLPARRSRKIIVLAHDLPPRKVRRWLTAFTADQVHVISNRTTEWRFGQISLTHHLAQSLDHIHWHVKLIGPVDVVIDLGPGPIENYYAMWRQLFFHLNPGGCYVIDTSTAGVSAFGGSASDWMGSIVNPAHGISASEKLTKEFANCAEQLTMSRGLILIQKRHRHYIKLRDSETNRVLPAREPAIGLHILARRAPGTTDSTVQVISHKASVPIRGLDENLSHPAMYLRHYTGQIAFAGSTLVYTKTAVLPDSFRHHLSTDPQNPRVGNVSPDFVRIPAKFRPRETLPGDYYLLDCTYPNHFGHVITEVVPRLWGWEEARRAIPGLKAVFAARPWQKPATMLESRVFRAYGIDPTDIMTVQSPVLLESIVSATTMWHNDSPHYVHPELLPVLERVSAGLIDESAPSYDRIFVSRARRWSHRTCRNAADVERLFESFGFTVIYPENHPIGVQAAIFARAMVIAGFGGSAMSNLLHARSMRTLIVLSHESYISRIEHLYSVLLGCEVHYFWSAADSEHPAEGFSQEALFSDWEFDFARHRVALTDLLASL